MTAFVGQSNGKGISGLSVMLTYHLAGGRME